MTTLTTFQVGQQPIITATFADVTGGAAVATAATFIIRTPGGVETAVSSPNASITNPSSNVWKYTMPSIVVGGNYIIRAKTTTGLVAAGEATLPVVATGFVTP